MKLVTPGQMKELEHKAICDFSIPGIILMEDAAVGFCATLSKKINVSGIQAGVFCGRGNNGGDGFAIARILNNLGAFVTIITAFDEKPSTNDAQANFDIIKKMGIPVLGAYENTVKFDIIIDAVLGTGAKGAPRETEAHMIDRINTSGAFVASVDIPSGACAHSGAVFSECVRANMTVTFCMPKTGHFLYPAKDFTGEVFTVPISIPHKEIDDLKTGFYTLDKNIIQKMPSRPDVSYKGSFGRVLVFAGSPGMSGACVLSTGAVLKSGAGLVKSVSHRDVCTALSVLVPEAITKCINGDVLETLLAEQDAFDVLLVGCGIGKSEDGARIMRGLLSNFKKPMIIDADGINNLAENIDILYDKKAPVVLTPHTVEFARISGLSPEYIEKNRAFAAKEFALSYGVTLVLKGANTVVACPNGDVHICMEANSGLATAGSGDVLAGIITGITAGGATLPDAACLGVYIHSVAGSLAREELGVCGMMAGDVMRMVPKAISRASY